MNRQETFSLIEEHYRNNYDAMLNRLKNNFGKPDAEDIVQEAYTRALEYWQSFDVAEGSIREWMGGILNNCISNQMKLIRQEGAVIDSEEIDEIISHSIWPSETDRKTVEEIRKEMEEREEEECYILKLFFILGYQPADIEKITSKTNGAIRQIVYRFKQEMKEKYK